MINFQQIEAMTISDVLIVEGYTVTRRMQKNGKLIWVVNGWDLRSPKQVISWIKWDIKQQKRFSK